MCRTAGIAAGLRPGGQTLRLVRMKIDKTSAGIYSGQCHGGACLLRKVCRIASIAGRLLEEKSSGASLRPSGGTDRQLVSTSLRRAMLSLSLAKRVPPG